MKRFLLYCSILILSTIMVLRISGEDKMKKMNKKPQTVSKVDLKRYIGLWYEIAKIPNRFQKKCVGNTMAKYRFRKDGRIIVTNSCSNQKGAIISTKGVAKIVAKDSNSKLKVSFVKILGIRLFWGDYWIIGLDENFKYAVIGDPKRKYGWILGREKKLSETQWSEINKILSDQGYDQTKFIKTSHSE